MSHVKKLVLVLCLMLLPGCMNSYVDPGFAKISVDKLKQPSGGTVDVQVKAKYLLNGEHKPGADKYIIAPVERVLLQSGVFKPYRTDQSIVIDVVLDNKANLEDAAAKGFATGFTFGLVGSGVTDFYEFKVVCQVNGQSVTRSYKHALHTTIGAKEPPFPNAVSYQPQEGFEVIVGEVMNRYIKDMQDAGYFL